LAVGARCDRAHPVAVSGLLAFDLVVELASDLSAGLNQHADELISPREPVIGLTGVLQDDQRAHAQPVGDVHGVQAAAEVAAVTRRHAEISLGQRSREAFVAGELFGGQKENGLLDVFHESEMKWGAQGAPWG
jgi:hypothetical protein